MQASLRRLPELRRGDKLYCRRKVRVSGRTYAAGQELPYRQLSIPWRRLLQMYAAKQIVKRDFFSVDEWIKMQVDNPATKEGELIEMRPVGGGWFNILVSGVSPFKRRFREEAAEKKIENLRQKVEDIKNSPAK